MSEPTAQRHSSSHAIRSATASALTEVEVTWIEKRYEQWIRFGRIAADTIINRRTRVIAFRPGAVFAFVRWSSNDYGTIHSCIDIVTAVAPGRLSVPALTFCCTSRAGPRSHRCCRPSMRSKPPVLIRATHRPITGATSATG